MAISFNRYINIISGVGAATSVPRRDLIGRLFSDNSLLPTGTLLEFNNATEVGLYFGTDSEEYLRAVFYFSFISKLITSPNKIGYFRWADAATAPQIYGSRFPTLLNAFQAIDNGAFSLTLGSTTHILTGLDFTSTLSLADVAAVLQVAIRAADISTQWTAATVTYDADRGSFDLIGGATGNAVVLTTTAGSGTEIVSLIGWLYIPQVPFIPSSAIFSNGSAIQTITEVLDQSEGVSNNFGSFLFMPSLTNDQITEAATWNASKNVLYQYYARVTVSTAAAVSAATIDLAGTGLTLAPLTEEYPEMAPMMILASTDYSSQNAAQNYMFQEFNLTASVNNDTDANFYDGLMVNYYGQTQTAGQFLEFYQRGVLTGLDSDPTDMNVYANEQWLKDEAAATLMELLIALPEISANQKGRAQILASLQTVIQLALINGTISVGKPLTNTQILYINEISGNSNAYRQVQTIGYWVNVQIDPISNEANYILVYSKDDVVRKIDGTHSLI